MTMTPDGLRHFAQQYEALYRLPHEPFTSALGDCMARSLCEAADEIERLRAERTKASEQITGLINGLQLIEAERAALKAKGIEV